MRYWVCLGLFGLAACGGNSPPTPEDLGVADGSSPDAGSVDVLTSPDAAALLDAAADAGFMDAEPAPDAAADAGVADSGILPVGEISGPCGELDDAELLGAEPSVFQNAINFPTGYTMADMARLSPGAQEILRDGTAGGSSGLSEAISFELLHRCEGAVLIKSETEVIYDDPMSKKTDILVEIDGYKIGVSVTRAVGFPRDDPYTPEQAAPLIARKLSDILESTENVTAADAWRKQILHVIAYGPMHAESVRTAAGMIDSAILADTILWVTVTNGDDAFIY